MASPKLEVFVVYHNSTLIPFPGQTIGPGSIEFLSYIDDLGAAVTPRPTIFEIGGGAYGFLPVFPVDPNRGVVYVVATGPTPGTPSSIPNYYSRYMRPEDYAAEGITAVATAVSNLQSSVTAQGVDITLLRKIMTNRWKIHTTGPNAFQLVFYEDDKVTILKKFDLKDSTGVPTATTPFERNPNP